MDQNIYGDFQICISVPLNFTQYTVFNKKLVKYF